KTEQVDAGRPQPSDDFDRFICTGRHGVGDLPTVSHVGARRPGLGIGFAVWEVVTEGEAGRVPTGPFEELAQMSDRGDDLLETARGGHPAIAGLHRRAEGAWTVTADPDGYMRLLHAGRKEMNWRDGEEGALVGRLWL